jgi:hypothetical protein
MRRVITFAAVACSTALWSGSDASVSGVQAQTFEPQLKINHIDTSKAPLVRVFASVLASGARPVDEKLITQVKLYRKPEGAPPEELFGFEDGELKWPKSMDEEAIKKKEKEKAIPELAFAGDLKDGAAIAVVAPGFQDLEYRAGILGAMSRSAAALFFKKLGAANSMNFVWYNDFVRTYIFKDGLTSGFNILSPDIITECRRWEEKELETWGMTADELAELNGGEPPPAPNGPRKGEARCTLHSNYADFPNYIGKQAYEGYWPQLFGIGQVVEPCAKPEFNIAPVSRAGEGEDERLQAFDVALEMVARGAKAGQPRIVILTGDGRDGYINSLEECRFKFESECDAREDIATLARRAANNPKDRASKLKAAEVRKSCLDEKRSARLNQMRAAEQAVFARKLPVWLGLAKAANIRVYSVIHPTALPHTRERLELLAWRTGGTPRYAADSNEVASKSDELVEELNGQIVLTFTDDTVKATENVAYVIEARAGRSTFKSEPFKVLVPPKYEPGFVANVKSLGESKLGKTGFLAVAIGVGLLLLVIILKLVMKLFKSGEAAAAKASKGGKGADKARAKAIERAKKLKEAQKKAAEKAKKGG